MRIKLEILKRNNNLNKVLFSAPYLFVDDWLKGFTEVETNLPFTKDNWGDILEALCLEEHKVLNISTFNEETIVTFHRGKFFKENVLPQLKIDGYILKDSKVNLLKKDKDLLKDFKNKHILTNANNIAQVLQVTNQIKAKKKN
jgi:hypothetical protein